MMNTEWHVRRCFAKKPKGKKDFDQLPLHSSRDPLPPSLSLSLPLSPSLAGAAQVACASLDDEGE